jgi:hypothetical protein
VRTSFIGSQHSGHKGASGCSSAISPNNPSYQVRFDLAQVLTSGARCGDQPVEPVFAVKKHYYNTPSQIAFHAVRYFNKLGFDFAPRYAVRQSNDFG